MKPKRPVTYSMKEIAEAYMRADYPAFLEKRRMLFWELTRELRQIAQKRKKK